jgi:hypothetical protein
MSGVCPTEDCSTVPPRGFVYCREHAGTERDAYATLAVVERERDTLRAALDRIAKAHAPAEHLQNVAREALSVSPEGEA